MLFMLKQQHYKLSKVKKKKSEIIIKDPFKDYKSQLIISLNKELSIFGNFNDFSTISYNDNDMMEIEKMTCKMWFTGTEKH